MDYSRFILLEYSNADRQKGNKEECQYDSNDPVQFYSFHSRSSLFIIYHVYSFIQTIPYALMKFLTDTQRTS